MSTEDPTKLRRHRAKRSTVSTTLHVDDAAEHALARIFGDLRSARIDAGLTQNELAAGLPFRGRAISEWETGYMEPTLEHLMQVARKLHRRLVILGPNGELCTGPLRRRAGEVWAIFERRRLALTLRRRREALNLTQEELGRLVGVSRDTIVRWEAARVPPRPIALVVWAHRLGYSVALRSIDASQGPVDPGDRLLRV